MAVPWMSLWNEHTPPGGYAGRQGALANGPVWAAPEEHRHLFTRGLAVQPVSEGLKKTGEHGETRSPIDVNRCLMGSLGFPTGSPGAGRARFALTLGDAFV